MFWYDSYFIYAVKMVFKIMEMYAVNIMKAFMYVYEFYSATYLCIEIIPVKLNIQR